MRSKTGLKRASWVDSITSAMLSDPDLDRAAVLELSTLDECLFAAWNLGENIVLAWTRDDRWLRFLAVRHYELLEPRGHRADDDNRDGRSFIDAVLAGSKCLGEADFVCLCSAFGQSAQIVSAPLGPYLATHPELISGLVSRYTVSLIQTRAVVLLDAVNFSLHSPLEQVAMLNSLSYSVNSAYRQMISTDVQINFARTTTGDGFYIWNRASTIEANIALYKLLLLVLADNAVAQSKASRFPVPKLRAAFHVGEHYEFSQVEALNPTTFSYIVGQVTIELARFLEKALPGQIILGDFKISMPDAGDGRITTCDTRDFISRAATMLRDLEGLAVANDRVASISCYLTGEHNACSDFAVRCYQIRDKHDLTHVVYNAKLNIHLTNGAPIYLGYQHKDLHPPGESDSLWA